MKRILFSTAVTLTIVAAVVSSASAQKKYGVKKNIAFKRGEVSKRVVGILKSHLEIHEYHFHATAGQKMKIDLVSNDKNIGFYIMTIPDGYMMTDDVAVRSFDNDLPDTGEYKLVVETDTRRGSRYALEFTIEQPGKHMEQFVSEQGGGFFY